MKKCTPLTRLGMFPARSLRALSPPPSRAFRLACLTQKPVEQRFDNFYFFLKGEGANYRAQTGLVLMGIPGYKSEPHKKKLGMTPLNKGRPIHVLGTSGYDGLVEHA